MIRSAVHKHVQIGIASGIMIEGFVQESDEKFFKIIERNNSVIVIRIDDISYVRIASTIETQEEESYELPLEPAQTTVHPPASNDEYAMPLPTMENCCYKTPIFKRNS